MIDWDDAFDNSGYVAGARDLPETWAGRAHAFRATHADRSRLDLAYGPSMREVLDLFEPIAKPNGTVVFVHGGYWHLFDKNHWSHLARGCTARGWTVAMPSYPLAPEARISDITISVARAVAFAAEQVPGPVRLVGHSAGGHLVSRMMCVGVLPEAIAERLARVVSVSGVHELMPLTATRMNETLNLTEAEARAESPALCVPLRSVPVTFWVGARERPEFLRQARLIEERWAALDVDAQAVYEPGHNHFSVVESLQDADGALTNEVLR